MWPNCDYALARKFRVNTINWSSWAKVWLFVTLSPNYTHDTIISWTLSGWISEIDVRAPHKTLDSHHIRHGQPQRQLFIYGDRILSPPSKLTHYIVVYCVNRDRDKNMSTPCYPMWMMMGSERGQNYFPGRHQPGESISFSPCSSLSSFPLSVN